MKKLYLFCALMTGLFSLNAQNSLESKHSETEIEGDVRIDILPSFKTSDEERQKDPAQLKLFGLAEISSAKHHVVLTGMYNYAMEKSFDLGATYAFKFKHGLIGPHLSILAGNHFGIAPGFLAHAGNEKVHFFTQTEYIAELGKEYTNSVFSLIELSYHPVHYLSFGIEPETKIIFKEKIEVEEEVTLFLHIHLKRVFFGLGYMFEPPKLGVENIRNISAIRISIGAKFP